MQQRSVGIIQACCLQLNTAHNTDMLLTLGMLTAGQGWHKAGPSQQLPPHVAWNDVTEAERRALNGSASAENLSRGQQTGSARPSSYRLPQGDLPASTSPHGLLCKALGTQTAMIHMQQ